MPAEFIYRSLTSTHFVLALLIDILYTFSDEECQAENFATILANMTVSAVKANGGRGKRQAKRKLLHQYITESEGILYIYRCLYVYTQQNPQKSDGEDLDIVNMQISQSGSF